MKTGSRGLALIKSFESLRLKAYRDTGGVLTVGYGHTAMAGPPKPTPGMTITRGEADAIFARDLVQYERAVEHACPRRQPTQSQFDAMTSLCFNIGADGFRKSTVVKAFNAGDDDRAANAFLAWNKDNGRVLPGLIRRRKAERRLFLSQTGGAKWAVAGAGGATAGTGFLATFGESAASSLGYSLADMMSWQFLACVAGVAAALAVVALAFMGHDRRERLWNRLFGGWLS